MASAYINEYIGSKGRGRFFLLYEVMFLFGLLGAGIIGYLLVPVYGWKAMFIVGLAPSLVMIPLRFFMRESPRWLASKGRYEEADRIVSALERSVIASGKTLPPPVPVATTTEAGAQSNWRELFKGIYLKRTLTIWALWFCSYLVANGMITWLPTLYRQHFQLPLETSLMYGLLTSLAGVIASVACALLIDKVGRKRWYTFAFLGATLPLMALAALGATSAIQVLVLAALAYAIVRRSPSRCISIRRNSTRPGCGRSVLVSAARGSGLAPPPDRWSSAWSSPTSGSSMSSSCSPARSCGGHSDGAASGRDQGPRSRGTIAVRRAGRLAPPPGRQLRAAAPGTPSPRRARTILPWIGTGIRARPSPRSSAFRRNLQRSGCTLQREFKTMRKFLLATTAMAAVAGFTPARPTPSSRSPWAATPNSLPRSTTTTCPAAPSASSSSRPRSSSRLTARPTTACSTARRSSCRPDQRADGLGSTGVGTDEASVYVGGIWGRIELGDFDGAADTLAIYAPLVGVESIDGDYGDFVNVTVRRHARARPATWAASPGAARPAPSKAPGLAATPPRSCT